MDQQLKERIALLLSRGFDRPFAEMEVLEAGGGRARVRLEVTEPLQNVGGALHGGAIATLVDDVGTLAIVTGEPQGRPGVTSDLNVSFFAPGTGVVIVEATVLKIGRTLAFVAVDVRRAQDNVLVAQGRMTKHLGV